MQRIGLRLSPTPHPRSTVVLALLVGFATIVMSLTASSARARRQEHEAIARFRVKVFDADRGRLTRTGLVGWVIDDGKEQLGVVESRVSITSQPDPSYPSTFETTGDDRFYFRAGSIRGTATGTTTLHLDGSRATTSRGTFVGGTRKFRGTTGTYTATCSNPADADVTSVTTCELQGQISY